MKKSTLKQNLEIPEDLYTTNISKKKENGNNNNLLSSENKELNYKPEVMLKYKKKSKEEIKNSHNIKGSSKGKLPKKLKNGIKRKVTVERTIPHDVTLTKKCLHNSKLVQHSK